MVIRTTHAREDAIRARAQCLLTVKEYADLHRCSTKTVYRLLAANLVPGATRFGGQWLIEVAPAPPPARV